MIRYTSVEAMIPLEACKKDLTIRICNHEDYNEPELLDQEWLFQVLRTSDHRIEFQVVTSVKELSALQRDISLLLNPSGIGGAIK
jgi:hypothetical protein